MNGTAGQKKTLCRQSQSVTNTSVKLQNLAKVLQTLKLARRFPAKVTLFAVTATTAAQATATGATKGVGVNRNGAFAEYLCIPATNVIEIEDDLDEEVVSFFDAFGNATHTALYWDLVGKNVLITGAGPIGIMAAAICKFAGARTVVITDVNEYRLDLALKMGATRAVNVSKDRLGYVMHELGIKEGFDIGLEMSGAPAAFNQMLENMIWGGKVSMLGLFGGDVAIDWNKVIMSGLTVQGIYGRKMFQTWYQMKNMVQGGLDMSGVITHRYHYTDFQKGFEAMISGKSGKVVLDWTEKK